MNLEVILVRTVLVLTAALSVGISCGADTIC